jgi:hypothetical protein
LNCISNERSIDDIAGFINNNIGSVLKVSSSNSNLLGLPNHNLIGDLLHFFVNYVAPKQGSSTLGI